MGFQGVYRALYDHEPHRGPDNEGDAELPIRKGDMLYIIEKDEEANWWRARKKAPDDNEDEPEGLVPKNYVEKAEAIGLARALYEYTRQTEEELSLMDGALLEVFDTSDPDWTLVGLDNDFGFVPSNYIETMGASASDNDLHHEESDSTPPLLPVRPAAIIAATTTETTQENMPPKDQSVGPTMDRPEVTVRDEIPRRVTTTKTPPDTPTHLKLNENGVGKQTEFLSSTSGGLSSHAQEDVATHPLDWNRNSKGKGSGQASRPSPLESPRTPGGFHLYNINEMVSVLGKKKKMPSTLGINIVTRTILIAPEKAQDGPSQEWTAENMTHYSREGKHVFLELVKPSRGFDFHAGAKDTAEEVVSALGELAGAVKAAGLQNAILTAGGLRQKRGIALYDFVAQGDDEVTVDVGDEVIILDDTKSEEWWSVRRVKTGKEGVVPGSYIEAGSLLLPSSSSLPLPMSTSFPSVKSTVEQNRLEEKRLTNEAIKAQQKESPQQVGPGMTLPARGSSLSATDEGNTSGQIHSKRETGSGIQGKTSRPKPDASKLRTWTDRTKSFSVEAQFIGLKDGKINLHKANGVKIAVPITKMSVEDLEYVERVTGISLSHDKLDARKPVTGTDSGSRRKTGATIEKAQKPEYDWFQFFLSCEVPVGLCERYAQAFMRDGMDESVLPDVDATVLRTLGLKEGDIIKVMRVLDSKSGRTGKRNEIGDSDSSGGLFSGPGGALRNNTKKGRPAPAVETSAIIDPKAFMSMDDNAHKKLPISDTVTNVTPDVQRGAGKPGFDDNAWDLKPSKSDAHQQAHKKQEQVESLTAVSEGTANTAASSSPTLVGSMQDLSLLTTPLQPTRTRNGSSMPTSAPVIPSVSTQSQPPPAIVNPMNSSLFEHINSQVQPALHSPRQRPTPPQLTETPQGALMPPPRPLSAPQSAQPSAFSPPPLLPQMTGQPAPPGQSLLEINQARMQQQQPFFQSPGMVPQLTGLAQQATGLGQYFNAQPQTLAVSHQYTTVSGTTLAQSPFSDPPQPSFQSGFPNHQPYSNSPVMTGSINSFNPSALEPQRTGMLQYQPLQPSSQSGMTTLGRESSNPGPSVQRTQTGQQPPEVRFGIRRADLSQATPQNPFGLS